MPGVRRLYVGLVGLLSSCPPEAARVHLAQAARVHEDSELLLAAEGEEQRVAVECVDCPEYVKLSASEKQQVLWQKLISDEYQGAFPMNFPNLGVVNFRDLRQVAWNGTMAYAFDRFSDENPTEHAKVIHTFGSVANMRMEAVPNDLGLTGLFQGGDYGIIRMSLVADWTKACKGGIDLDFKGCFKPGFAVKMLRDGDFSSNFFAQPNLGDGVGRDYNWFNHAQSTWLPQPTGFGAAVVKSLFSYAANADQINGIGVTELATQGSIANQDPSEIKAPRRLYFLPSDGVKHMFKSEVHDVREDFKNLEVGTALYDVVVPLNDTQCLQARDSSWLSGSTPADPILPANVNQTSCPYTVVAKIVTTSRFVASAWGDRRLFFQHERVAGGKGGKWRRKACVASENSAEGSLPSTAAYRMAGDLKRTCTQKCHSGTQEAVASSPCPFAKLD